MGEARERLLSGVGCGCIRRRDAGIERCRSRTFRPNLADSMRSGIVGVARTVREGDGSKATPVRGETATSALEPNECGFVDHDLRRFIDEDDPVFVWNGCRGALTAWSYPCRFHEIRLALRPNRARERAERSAVSFPDRRAFEGSGA